MSWRTKIIGITATAMMCAMAIVVVVPLAADIRGHRNQLLQVEQHLANHQGELSDAVLSITDAHQQGVRLNVELLPAALKAPGIELAICGSRNVTLIVSHSPDAYRGFRVWRGQQDAEYFDTPTEIPGVYRFVYCDDYPESATNRPD